MPLFSLGLNALEEKTFLKILEALKIEYIIDIRHPQYKTKPWCKPINLKEIKRDQGAKYVYWVKYLWSNLPGLECETIQRQKLSIKELNHLGIIVRRLTKAHMEYRAMLCCSHEKMSDCIVGKVLQPMLKKNGVRIHRVNYIENDLTVDPPIAVEHHDMKISKSLIDSVGFWHGNEGAEWWR